jgi:hypothetical protein
MILQIVQITYVLVLPYLRTPYYLVVGKVFSLLNLTLQIGKHFLEPSLFVRSEFPKAKDLFDTIGSKFAGRGKVLGIRQGTLDIGALNDLFSSHALQDLFGKLVPSIGHAESGGTGSGLGLDDFVASKLGADGEGFAVGIAGGESLDLAKQGQNGNAGVSTNDGDTDILGCFSHVGSDKGVGTADIQSGDTADLFGVVDAVLLHDFGGDGDGRVDGVADNGQDGIGAKFGAAFHQGLDDSCFVL